MGILFSHVWWGSLKHFIRIVPFESWSRSPMEEGCRWHIAAWCLLVCMWYLGRVNGILLPSSGASGALLLGLTNKKSKNYAHWILSWDQEEDTGIYIEPVCCSYISGLLWCLVLFFALIALLNEMFSWFWGPCYWGAPPYSNFFSVSSSVPLVCTSACTCSLSFSLLSLFFTLSLPVLL